jgi:hypothetical protein
MPAAGTFTSGELLEALARLRESEVGVGTTFRIYLPRVSEEV